jgi:hypothetical protein
LQFALLGLIEALAKRSISLLAKGAVNVRIRLFLNRANRAQIGTAIVTGAALTTLLGDYAGVAANRDDRAEIAKPPNILFILNNDLGWVDVGYHGSDIQTPTIDRMVPVCSPTRRVPFAAVIAFIATVARYLPTDASTITGLIGNSKIVGARS